MPCAAHILNLVVQNGLVIFGDCFEKVRDNVLFWKKKFEESTQHVRILRTKELVIDVKTC